MTPKAHIDNWKLVHDKALVLLPSPGNKLEMRWQGPYTVTKVFKDGLNYELDTGKVRKQHRTYHINLLSKWQSRDESRFGVARIT